MIVGPSVGVGSCAFASGMRSADESFDSGTERCAMGADDDVVAPVAVVEAPLETLAFDAVEPSVTEVPGAYGGGLEYTFLTSLSNALKSSSATFKCHSKYAHISRSIWLISRRANMPWPTTAQDLFE